MSVKVSVIVPVYNAGRYLQKCLRSISEQSLREIEIICINDGSTDDSMVILESFKDVDDRFCIIDNSMNMGLSYSRNIGMDVATGDYIQFVDSDDYLSSDALGILYETAIRDSLDMLIFNMGYEYENDSLRDRYRHYERKIEKETYDVYNGPEAFDRMRLKGEYSSSSVSEIWRKDFLRKNHLRFYEGIILEDLLFTATAFFYAKRVRWISDTFYICTRRENSITTSEDRIKNFRARLIVYSEFSRFVLEQKQSECFKYALSYLKDLYGSLVGEIRKIQSINYDFLDVDWVKNEYVATYFSILFDQNVFSKGICGFTSQIKKYRFVVLYGLGKIGMKTAFELENEGVSSFIPAVTKIGERAFFFGNRIREIRELSLDNSETVFLVATVPKHHTEMIDELERFGYTNYLLFYPDGWKSMLF